MSECCTTSDGTPAELAARRAEPGACRECGSTGPRVEHRTMFHVLEPECFERLQQVAYRFCATPACDVVYYADGEASSFVSADLRVKVGVKNPGEPSAQVCYCFGFTERVIADELRTSGSTSVAKRIVALVKQRLCACEVRNPAGVCCLAEVNRTIRRLSASSEVTPGETCSERKCGGR